MAQGSGAGPGGMKALPVTWSWTVGQLQWFQEQRAKAVVPDPTPGACYCQQHGKRQPACSEEDFEQHKNLQEITETNRLADLLPLRAEKYDSPEHAALLGEWRAANPDSAAPPRNQLNENYCNFLALLWRLRYENYTVTDPVELQRRVLKLLARWQAQLLTMFPERRGEAVSGVQVWPIPHAPGERQALLDPRWLAAALTDPRSPVTGTPWRLFFDYLYQRYGRRDICLKEGL